MESEALLETEGEFLVRESTKIQGQFVLSGIAQGGAQHLLLMNRAGKVHTYIHTTSSLSLLYFPVVHPWGSEFMKSGA